jgi:hypothetical protein
MGSEIAMAPIPFAFWKSILAGVLHAAPMDSRKERRGHEVCETLNE